MHKRHAAWGAALLALLMLGMVACQSTPTQHDLFMEAEKAQDEGAYTAAIKSYNRVLELYPTGEKADEAQFMIGFLYANQIGDTAKARDAYQTFLSEYAQAADSGMVVSAKWELANLGKNVEEMDLRGSEQ